MMSASCYLCDKLSKSCHSEEDHLLLITNDSLLTIADPHCKDYRDLGLPGVSVGPAENSVLPLVHIDPRVVSKVLYCGATVEGA